MITNIGFIQTDSQFHANSEKLMYGVIVPMWQRWRYVTNRRGSQETQPLELCKRVREATTAPQEQELLLSQFVFCVCVLVFYIKRSSDAQIFQLLPSVCEVQIFQSVCAFEPILSPQRQNLCDSWWAVTSFLDIS